MSFLGDIQWRNWKFNQHPYIRNKGIQIPVVLLGSSLEITISLNSTYTDIFQSIFVVFISQFAIYYDENELKSRLNDMVVQSD